MRLDGKKFDLTRTGTYMSERGDLGFSPRRTTMKLNDVPVDHFFRFAEDVRQAAYRPVFRHRGNGWYSTPGGYGGGPWCNKTNPEVVLRRDDTNASTHKNAK